MDDSATPTPETKTEKPASSPTPPIKIVIKGLRFKEVIDPLINGKFITREEWGDKNMYFTFKDDKLSLHKSNNTLSDCVLGKPDLMANDWIVL